MAVFHLSDSDSSTDTLQIKAHLTQYFCLVSNYEIMMHLLDKQNNVRYLV